MELSDFDDAELLELIADREFDAEVWKDASAEFFDRHITWFYGECTKKRHRIPSGDAEGFARDVFVSVIETKAASFSRRDIVDPDDLRRCVRAWLGRIAENRLSDYYRERAGILEQSNADHQFLTHVVPEPAPSQAGSAVEAASEKLRSLADRDRAIVEEYLKWEGAGRKIPSTVLQGMAEEFQLTSEAVRKVYYRFRQTVKTTIEKLNSHELVGQHK